MWNLTKPTNPIDESRGAPAGLTLIELMLAMTIMAMVVGTLGALARGVQQSYEYTEGHGLATQHARVVFDRIQRTIAEAHASDEFPGFIVVSEEESGWVFPNTLVVWAPRDTSGDPKPPRNPEGLPFYDELVVYCPYPHNPSLLMEYTFPYASLEVPSPDETARWRSELKALKGYYTPWAVQMTNLVRVCSVPEATQSADSWRGCVWFSARLRPSDSDWQQYLDGHVSWEDLPWVQGIYGSQTGLRQNWLRIELQQMPGEQVVAAAEDTYRPIAFFDSASLFYQMHKRD